MGFTSWSMSATGLVVVRYASQQLAVNCPWRKHSSELALCLIVLWLPLSLMLPPPHQLWEWALLEARLGSLNPDPSGWYRVKPIKSSNRRMSERLLAFHTPFFPWSLAADCCRGSFVSAMTRPVGFPLWMVKHDQTMLFQKKPIIIFSPQASTALVFCCQIC